MSLGRNVVPHFQTDILISCWNLGGQRETDSFLLIPKCTCKVVAPPASILSKLLHHFSAFSFQSSFLGVTFSTPLLLVTFLCFSLACFYLLLPDETKDSSWQFTATSESGTIATAAYRKRVLLSEQSSSLPQQYLIIDMYLTGAL